MFTLVGVTPLLTLQKEMNHRIRQAMRTPRGTIEHKLAWDHIDDLRKKIDRLESEKKKPDDVDCEMDPLACRIYDV